ncbi:MAG: enoyl-CoA hydratase/isomerase family protein [bacterium]|nr:enoyl-CoA hydratase/isomerase family protein [Gammaproteobacteria bacterium]
MNISVEKQDGVTRLQLNRPERRNAFNSEMVVQLHQNIVEALTEANCRCLVICGAGEHFCAGRDLRDVKSESPVDDIIGGDDLWSDIFRLLDECDLPSVSVVRGYAYAGGFTLAMGCDFVLADQSARFQVSEMRHSFPAAINTPVLSKLVGPRLALELAVLGETVTAERLYAMGLINRLVEDAAALERETESFIGTILSRDKVAIGQTKRLHRATRQGTLSVALNMGSLINTQAAMGGKFAKAGQSLKNKGEK